MNASAAPKPDAAIAGILAKLGKSQKAHKYDHGHALILSGGAGQGGAARLAAQAALRIGAGLVSLGCPPDAITENAAQLNAIMLRPLAGGDELAALLKDGRINALCLGPALGQGERTGDLVHAALAERRATVLDADALTFFQDDPDRVFERLHPACILTPHGGEFARLFPDIAATLARGDMQGGGAAKRKATAEAAQRAGCTIILKGAATTIADHTGRTDEQNRPAPWLATAGSGDVLAGIATGLLARGFDTMEAARAAVWLHSKAGRSLGAGLIAEDIPQALPAILKTLGH